jgi:hypothetical protein
LKTNAAFKLSKQSKIHCCHYLDPHLRADIRKSFIEAEVMQHLQPRVSKQKKEEKKNADA